MIPSGMYRADAAQEEGAFGGTGGLAVNTSHVQPGGYGGISATDGDPASQGSASYEMSWQQLQQREAQVQQRIRELLNDPSMQQHLHSEPVQWDAGMDQPSRIPSTTDAQCFIHGGPLSKSPLSVLDYGKAPGVGMSVLASSMDPSQPYHDKQNSSQQYAGQTWHGGFVGNAVEERFMPSEKLMHQAEGHHQVAESSSNIERPEDPVTMIDPSLLLSAEEVARLQPSDARNYYAALEEVRRQSAVESSGLDDNGIDEGRVGANIHEGKAQSYPGYFSQLALRLQGRGRYFMDRLAVSISQAAPILKNVSKVLLSSEDSALRAADLDGSSAHEPRPGLHTVEPIQLGSKFRSTKRRLENSKPKTPAAPRLTLSTVYSELGIRMKGHTGLMTALMMCMFLVLIGAIRFMFRGGFLADIPPIAYNSLAESIASYKYPTKPLKFPSFCVPFEITSEQMEVVLSPLPHKVQLKRLIDARTSNGKVSVCGWFQEGSGLYVYMPQYQSPNPAIAVRNPTDLGRDVSIAEAKQAIKHCLGLSFAYDDMSFKLRPEDCKGSVFKSCKGSSPFYSGASDIIQQFVDKITASETAILMLSDGKTHPTSIGIHLLAEAGLELDQCNVATCKCNAVVYDRRFSTVRGSSPH